MQTTYDPTKVVLVFLGAPIVGFADGTFIKVDRNEDTWSLTVGSDGQGVRTRNPNQSGRVTITLMQHSPSVPVLRAAAVLDELTGEGVGPLGVKDLNGTDIHAAENAWIVKPPPAEYAKEVGNVEVIIECEKLFLA